MTKTSVRESAFFTPRILVGCGFGAIAVALTLLAFFALPKHSALAVAAHCSPPDIYYEYGGPTGILIDMDSDTETDPAYECIVFYTTNGSNPTHNGPNATGPYTSRFYGAFSAPSHQWREYRALGYNASYLDSSISSAVISNPPE